MIMMIIDLRRHSELFIKPSTGESCFAWCPKVSHEAMGASYGALGAPQGTAMVA